MILAVKNLGKSLTLPYSVRATNAKFKKCKVGGKIQSNELMKTYSNSAYYSLTAKNCTNLII